MKPLTTKKAIAAALHISRDTLDRYLGMPGAPKEGKHGWDFAAVSKWVKKNAKTHAVGTRANPDLAALKIRELKLRCDRLAHKLETERGLYIPKAVIGPALRNASAHFRGEFQRAEQELPARLVNRTELEIGKELQTRFDKIFAVLASNTTQWMEK